MPKASPPRWSLSIPAAQPTCLLIGEGQLVAAAARALEAHAFDGVLCESMPDACSRASKHGQLVAVICSCTLAPADTDGIESLRRELPETPVIVLCERLERRELRCALAAGAGGVVLADADLEQTLLSCIAAVQAGQVCVPHAGQREIAPPVLSTREKQILGLVVMGYMNSQIASQLFLAESTVKSHLSSAFAKLGVHSRNEAASLILDPNRGLGMGILGLVGATPRVSSAAAGRA